MSLTETFNSIYRSKSLLRLIFYCLSMTAFFMSLVGNSAYAATYAYRTESFSYDTPSGSALDVSWHNSGNNPACTSYPNGDDDWADINFPSTFSFRFGGTIYNSVRVYSNGILAFGNDTSGFHRAYTNTALPITYSASNQGGGCPRGVPENIMAVYWNDIVAGTANNTSGASVKYELINDTSTGQKRFVISWVNVKLYGSNTRYNFQVALYESLTGVNGNFKYNYTTGSSTGSDATVGVQLTTTDYSEYAYNQGFIDTSNGTSVLWYPANQLAAKYTEYRFDEINWLGTTNEIKDTSGNSLDASIIGSVSNTANGKLCRGGIFSNNTSSNTIDAIATPVIPGKSGSIDFWYKSNLAWNAGASNVMFFDATKLAAEPFFFMKLANGRLRFSITDSAGTVRTAETSSSSTFAANTWHHVGVSWNINVGSNQTVMKIFLDGNLATTNTTTPYRTTTSGNIASLNTIYIGDNRSTGITPSGGTSNAANGTIDEFYIYPVEINITQVQADMDLTRSTCSTLDHFHIIHSGTVSNCASPANITIEAHSSTHGLFSLSGTSMNLSTSTGHGTWSNVPGGSINPLTAVGNGTGTASYTFANESSVIFGLSNTLSEQLNINVTSGTFTEKTGAAATCVPNDYTTGSTCDADLVFSCAKPSGFNCIASGANALNGHLYTKLSGTAFTFDVVALKDVDGNGISDAVETAYASDSDKTVTVELVDGSGLTACAARTPISPAVSQTLTFTKANQPTEFGRKSSANIIVSKAYPDLRCRVTDNNQSPSIVSCSTDNFAIRPGAVTLSTIPIMATPPSATSIGTIKTGANFTLRAATSTSGTDSYSGALTLDVTKLSAQTTAQDTSIASGGVIGTLNPNALISNSAPSNNARYDEVGYVYLAPGAYRDDTFTTIDSVAGDCISNTSTSDYLSATLIGGLYGCSIGNATAVSLGRFIPDHFDVTVNNNGVIAPVCSSGNFTYTGQPMSYLGTNLPSLTIKPMSSATGGHVTQNYVNKFQKLTPSGIVITSPTSDATQLGKDGVTKTALTATLNTGSLNNSSGTMTYILSASDQYTYARDTNAQIAPYVSSASLTLATVSDSEITATALPILTPTGAVLRYGRIKLQNAYGSELLDLPIPLEAQYWNGSAYVRNLSDSCTIIPANTIAMGNYKNQLNACETQIGYASGSGSLINGVSDSLRLTKPGDGNNGSVDLSINLNGATGSTCSTATPSAAANANMPWFGNNPTARATFGVYKTPIIYMRENY